MSEGETKDLGKYNCAQHAGNPIGEECVAILPTNIKGQHL